MLLRPSPGNLLLCALLLVVLAPRVRADSELLLDARVRELLETTLSSDSPSTVDEAPLYRTCLAIHEGLEPLLEHLEVLARIEEEKRESEKGSEKGDAEAAETADSSDEKAEAPAPPAEVIAARWLLARLSWRHGLLEEAHELFELLARDDPGPLTTLRLAQLTDALGDTEKAVRLYKRILGSNSGADEELRQKVRLRLAILASSGAKVSGLESLEDHAQDRDPAYRNRAAVVLALTGKPAQALGLYQALGEENALFQQEARLTEWAMAAKNLEQAREHAWNALEAARLKRDRRYALTLLSEAHRREKKLDELIERFSKLEEPGEEVRQAWIDLLRETGKIDEAVRLFREGAEASGFTVENRRELLEICRESGREDLLIQSYRDMIETEPRRVEWRAGLSRYHLEQGDREAGLAVWEDFGKESTLRQLLEAAAAAEQLGLDELVEKLIGRCLEEGDEAIVLETLYFAFDFHRRRAREERAREALERMDELAAPTAPERVQLAEAWEQMGRHDQAARILEGLRTARGPEAFAPDLEMRLAWLYSETGQEEKAYRCWKSVWLKVDSPGRRRYVEERLMATASRLGNLADIAIELEEKLASGQADKRDSGLLVRLYTRVGDPVSAAEITEEYLRRSGGDEIKMLEEKARIYVLCNDYYHYEKTLRRLIEIDPEGTPEYLTQLAMSALERGRNDQARQILIEMRDLEANPAAAEFEAGVLKIAGLHDESVKAYWRGIGENPGRIDAYLLLGQALQTINRGRQAVGLFQYLVENAEKDDLFTIAVDGLLNARAGAPVIRWARRILLERVASREDRVYLFQLVSDLAEELRDEGMKRRALEEILPIAGEQRTSTLRELMELSKGGIRRSAFSTASANIRKRDDLLHYGRRLIGMGERVPPQIYLDLGQAFLESDDILNAAKTFDRADQSSDYVGYQRKVAQTFEAKQYARSALRVYERLLVSASHDVSLYMKVGELEEQLGRDSEASRTFRHGLDLLLESQTLFSGVQDRTATSNNTYAYYYARNVDNYQKYRERLLRGFLATVDDEGLRSFFEKQLEKLERDLRRIHEEEDVDLDRHLDQLPRLERRASILRRLAFSTSSREWAREVESRLIAALPRDPSLFAVLAGDWVEWGHEAGFRELAREHPDHPGLERVRPLVRESSGESPARQIYLTAILGEPGELERQLRTLPPRELDSLDAREREVLLAAAMLAGDGASIETLARHEIASNPSQIIYQGARVLGACLPFLEPERQESLIAHVTGLVEARSDQIGSSQWYSIQNLIQITGQPVRIPTAKVQAQIQSTLARGANYFYYMGIYFNLLPEEDYRSVLLESFAQAKQADRLRLLLELITAHPAGVPEERRETFLELAGSIEGDLDLKRNPFYKLTSPYQVQELENLDLILEFLERLAGTQPETLAPYFLGMRATLLARSGNVERALPPALEVFQSILEGNTEIERYSKTYIETILAQKEPARFLEVIDRVAEEKGESVELEKTRIRLAQKSGDPRVWLSSLEAAIRRHPGEKAFHQQYASRLKALGRPVEAARALEALLDLEPQNPATHRQVFQAWNQLQNSRRVAELQEKVTDRASEAARKLIEGTIWELLAPRFWTSLLFPQRGPAIPIRGGAKIVPLQRVKVAKASDTATDSGESSGDSAEKKEGEKEPEKEKKLVRPSIPGIKKALDADDPDEARLQLRRLWRQFQQLDNQYFSYTNVFSHSGSQYLWPVTGSSTSRPATSPPPGGLLKFLHDKRVREEKLKNPAPPRPHIFAALEDVPAIRGEAGRWLRSLQPVNYRGVDFEALLTLRARQAYEGDSKEEALTGQLREYREGRLDRLGVLVLLRMLELEPELSSPAIEAGLDLLIRKIPPGDQTLLPLLTRCLARRGRQETAANLYCFGRAYQRALNPRQRVYRPATARTDALTEVTEMLDGEIRQRTVERLVRLSAIYSQGIRGEALSQDRLTLKAWSEILPTAEVLEKTHDLCRSAVDTYEGINRDIVLTATRLLAAGGDVETASRGLETLIRWTPRSVYSRVYNPVYGGYYYTSNSSTRPGEGQLGTAVLHQCFPDELSTWRDPAGWLRAAAETLLASYRDGALGGDEALRALSFIGYRQTEIGRPDDVERTLSALESIPWIESESRLWLSDALRAAQLPARASRIEEELLDRGQLRLDRLGELLEEIATTRTVEEALAAAETAHEYTQRESLVETAAQLSTDAPGEDLRELWAGRLHDLIAAKPRPAEFGLAYVDDGRPRLFRLQELQEERLIHDRREGRSVVIHLAPGATRPRAFFTGDHELRISDSKIVDGEGRAWDLEAGHAVDDPSLVLEEIALHPWKVSSWESRHPGGDIYLVSALERADTIIRAGDGGWKFHEKREAPGEGWNQLHFDDSAWITGTAPLGYGESDILSNLSFGGDAAKKNTTAWFRREIHVPEGKHYVRLMGKIRSDDGAVVYLNGQEIRRFNMPAGEVDSTTFALKAAPEGQFIEFPLPAGSLSSGVNLLAVSVHQANLTSSDLVLDLELRGLTDEALLGEPPEDGESR